MASPMEMYSKFGLAKWIAQPNGENWSENDQWPTAISSSGNVPPTPPTLSTIRYLG